MTIERLSPQAIDEIRPLLAKCRNAPMRFLLRDAGCELRSYWLAEIGGWVRSGEGQVFVATEGNRIMAMAVYSDLAWDAALLGRPMGSIRYVLLEPGAAASLADALVAEVERWARSQGIAFLMGRSYADDAPLIHALQRNGFLLMDTMLDYVYDPRLHPLVSIVAPSVGAGVSIEEARDNDLPDLTQLARAAFADHFGRYHADPRINSTQSSRVYEEWMQSSMSGYADWLVIARCDGVGAGFSIWRKPVAAESALSVRVGHYSLAGVHPRFRGRGLFAALTYAGMRLLEGAADCVEGPTHVNNYPVHRAYRSLSWQVADARHSFHKWLQS